MSTSNIAKYLPVEIASTRFLPRKDISTRYPPSNTAGKLTEVWMSCLTEKMIE